MLKSLFSGIRLIKKHVCLSKNSDLFCTYNKDNEINLYRNQVKTQQNQNVKLTKEDKKKEQRAQQKIKTSDVQKEQIGPKFFSQIDLRIGEIIECWKHPQSENLYCEKINIKTEVREIASGLQKYIPLQKMKGKVLVIANLKPRPLAGIISNGMVMCASSEDKSTLQLIVPQGQIGERVFLQNFEDLFTEVEGLPVLNPKKKVLQKSIQHFKTNQQGFVIWKGIKLMTKAGRLKTNIKNGKVS